MKKRRILLWIIMAGLITGLGLGSGVCFQKSEKEKELYSSLELFSHALSMIQSKYVEEIDSKDLIYGALKGMLYSLDPYSQFLDPDSYKDMQVHTEGKFGGLGIEIAIKDNLLTIITPIHGTPADKAGVKAGDRIIKIDGESSEGITLLDSVKKLRGEPGTEVKLTIFREKAGKVLEISIIRDIIKIESLKGQRILENNIGYIRLVEFQEESSVEFEKVIIELKKEGMDALILDLRNNPGGLLDSAVNIADMFVPKNKLLVTTKGREGEQSYTFKSRRKPLLAEEVPIVVMVNQGSASGAEILAAVLQDYKRAVLIGQKTFGKGSVQTIIPLVDGSALRITTSKYFLPSGRSIHEKGIMPDVVVEDKLMEMNAEEKSKVFFDEVERKENGEIAAEETEAYDYQLKRAIDLIKGLRVYSERRYNDEE